MSEDDKEEKGIIGHFSITEHGKATREDYQVKLDRAVFQSLLTRIAELSGQIVQLEAAIAEHWTVLESLSVLPAAVARMSALVTEMNELLRALVATGGQSP